MAMAAPQYQTNFSPFAGMQGQGYYGPGYGSAYGPGYGPGYSTGQSFPTMAASSDPSTALLNLGIGAGSAILANNSQQAGANGAINMASYSPTGVSGPNGIGGITANGNNYSINGPTSGPFAGFNTLAGNGINYASGNVGANGFDTSAGNTLNAFDNFSLPGATTSAYNQLTALTQPTQTNQTQAMLNYEQASGRGGITQNGQLGDMGGLALAQSLADTNNALQANQLGESEGSYLSNTAQALATQGNAQRTAAMNTGTTGLEGLLGVNSSLQNLLTSSISASQARANAGANAGQFRYASGVNSGNAVGNFLGGAQQAASPFGGLGGLAKSGYNYLTSGGSSGASALGSGNTLLSNLGISPAYGMDAASQAALSSSVASDLSSTGLDAAASNGGFGNLIGSIGGDGFSGAGGQAAAQGVGELTDPALSGAADTAYGASAAAASSAAASSALSSAGLDAAASQGGFGSLVGSVAAPDAAAASGSSAGAMSGLAAAWPAAVAAAGFLGMDALENHNSEVSNESMMGNMGSAASTQSALAQQYLSGAVAPPAGMTAQEAAQNASDSANMLSWMEQQYGNGNINAETDTNSLAPLGITFGQAGTFNALANRGLVKTV